MSSIQASFREEFILPTNKAVGAVHIKDPETACTYLCGNSLGALSKRSKTLVQEEVEVWGLKAVEGHFDHPLGREWSTMTDLIHPLFAKIVGANEDEVCCMGTLTANLHLMMQQFYKPTSQRYKILCEARAFPSDQYAFASQVRYHGLDPKEAIIELSPRNGEFCLREEDILDTIAKEGSNIALVIFSGIQYYTGQLFPMKSITKAAKEQGCICGWDLAHAAGNVPMSLHEWDVDFAVWCTYKYMNSGPGGIAGIFLHDKWAGKETPMFAGWWGQDVETRFQMGPTFSGIRGAQGFQQSNPAALTIASLLGSLQVFEAAGMMQPLRERSVHLTGTLEKLLKASKFYIPLEQFSSTSEKGFTIITPSDPDSRGAQLSLLFLPVGSGVMRKVSAGLKTWGVIGDERKPDVIRLAPAPLYNNLEDCRKAAEYLEKIMEEV